MASRVQWYAMEGERSKCWILKNFNSPWNIKDLRPIKEDKKYLLITFKA